MTVESVLAHGLKTSVYGSQWNIEYAENLALLDPNRITSGLLANRPAAGAARRFYFAADNQKLYYDTGAAWIEQAGAPAAHASSHAGGGADAVTLAQSQVTNLTADLAGKEPANANIQAHIAAISNPHAVTKAQVGLGGADNTSDANKPVSTAQQAALNLKQDISGKDAGGGYAGLTLFKINFKNALNTITSFFTNANTAARTYTFQDRDGTIADNTDLAGKAADGAVVHNTGNETVAGVKNFSDTTDATGPAAAGALFSGGVGIAKKLFVGTLLDLSAATAGQIKFPVTQNASADANTLDDYEEGTWTPADGSGAGLSFISPVGKYTKIGRMVHVWFDVTYPSTANVSNAALSGLPFTSMAGTPYGGGNYSYTDYAGDLSTTVSSSATTLDFTGGGGYRSNANLSTKRVIGFAFYAS